MSADDRRTARRERFQQQRDAADDGSTPPPRGGGGGSDEDEQSSGGHDGLLPRSLFSPMLAVEHTALPGVRQITTTAGVRQLHCIDGAKLAEFVTGNINPDKIRKSVRDLLGANDGQVQITLHEEIEALALPETITEAEWVTLLGIFPRTACHAEGTMRGHLC